MKSFNRVFLMAVVTALLLPACSAAMSSSSQHFILHDESDIADPEYENRVLGAAEAALTIYLNMGFAAPVNISDPLNIRADDRIDIYIRNLPAEADGSKVYCSTNIDGLKKGYDYMEVTYDAGEQLEFAVAHDVFHTIQDAYDVQERKNLWIEEGTADLMASRVFNATSEYRLGNWEGRLLKNPEKSLLARSYDATLFWVHISQIHGDIKILEIWQALSGNSFNGIDGVKKALPEFDGDFVNFSEWLYLSYFIDRLPLSRFTTDNSTIQFAGGIEPYGARYIEINNTAESGEKIISGNLSIRFEKKSGKTIFHITVLGFNGVALSRICEESLSTSNLDRERAIEVTDMQNCSKVIFIIARLDRNPADPGEISLSSGEKTAAGDKTWTYLCGISFAVLSVAVLIFLKKKM